MICGNGILFSSVFHSIRDCLFVCLQIFIGKIPKEMFEDELIPLLEKCGEVNDLRLMMDPVTGLNRGYAFATYTTVDGAKEAVKQVCV